MAQRRYNMPLSTASSRYMDGHRGSDWSPTDDTNMASISTKLRRYFFLFKSSRLMPALLALVAVFLTYRLFFASNVDDKFGIVRNKKFGGDTRMDEREINDHLAALRDTRPSFCSRKAAPMQEFDFSQVSILLDFSGDEFYNLKLTLTSMLEHTDATHYGEILVIDDGSDNKSMYDIHKEFFQREKFSKVRVYRSDSGDGKAASRMKASYMAAGTFLVFVSSDVVVNTGWLLPLLQQVRDEPSTIAVPHHDNFLTPHRFFPTDDRLVNVPTWTLTTVHKESHVVGRETIATPVMRGDAFAIHKDLLDKLKNYDDSLLGGGHDLELSFRAWLCEGGIKIVLCSRVAVHNVLKPLVIPSSASIIRIAEQWMTSYTDIVYAQTGIESTSGEDEAVRVRKSVLRERMASCRPFTWYVQEVADLIRPSSAMQEFGKLQIEEAYCVHKKVLKKDLHLEECRTYIYEKEAMFELTTGGMLLHGHTCLMPRASDFHIITESCQATGNDHRWSLTADGLLVNLGMPGRCASHVTETQPDKAEPTHTVTMLPCTAEMRRKQKWSFIKY